MCSGQPQTDLLLLKYCELSKQLSEEKDLAILCLVKLVWKSKFVALKKWRIDLLWSKSVFFFKNILKKKEYITCFSLKVVFSPLTRSLILCEKNFSKDDDDDVCIWGDLCWRSNDWSMKQPPTRLWELKTFGVWSVVLWRRNARHCLIFDWLALIVLMCVLCYEMPPSHICISNGSVGSVNHRRARKCNKAIRNANVAMWHFITRRQ